MNFLIVANNLYYGGVTTSIVNFCNYYAQHNCNISIINLGESNKHITQQFDSRINFISLKGLGKYCNLSRNKLHNYGGISRIYMLLLGVMKVIMTRLNLWYPMAFRSSSVRKTFDVAIAFQQCEPCCYFVLNKCNARNKMLFIHGDIRFMGDITSWDKYLHLFDVISCVSDNVRCGFQNKYPFIAHKFRTIYNMFNIEHIKKQAEGDTNIFRIASFIITTVSRHDNSFKRLDLIPHICRCLCEMGIHDFHWYVVGDGPDFDFNQQLANDVGVAKYLSYVGKKDNAFPYLRACDVSVLTSISEAFPMVVKEAQILGKPVISTKYAGVEETIIHGKNGYIVEHNPSAIADMIRKLILRPELTNRLNFHKIGEETNELANKQFLSAIK